MLIDINAEKEKRSCYKCKYLGDDDGCNNPDYENFIMSAVQTRLCKGFESIKTDKKTEENYGIR